MKHENLLAARDFQSVASWRKEVGNLYQHNIENLLNLFRKFHHRIFWFFASLIHCVVL